MATDHAASIQGVALRVTKLDGAGAPIVGTAASFVTSAFMRFSFTPEYTDGDEIEEKGADGNICVYYKMPDTLKRVTFELAICTPDPELTALLIGGNLITESGATIGYSAPETGTDGAPNGVSIEVWSRAIVGGKPAATNPYWRWVFPYAKARLSGDRALENGLMANVFSGYALGNAGWDDGPQNDWDYSVDRAFQYARTDDAPTGMNAYQTVIA